MWVFLIVMIVGGLWHQLEAYKRYLVIHKKDPPSLAHNDQFGEFEVAGYKLRIPSRYMYTVYKMRGNRWFESKGEVQKVGGGIIFDVFMPEMKPYDMEMLKLSYEKKDLEVLRRKVYVSLAEGNIGYTPEQLIARHHERLGDKWRGEKEVYGLHKFFDAASGTTYYFQVDLTDINFRLLCRKSLCTVDVIYKQYPELKVHYFFNQVYLPVWRRINEGIKSLVGQFIVSSPQQATAKE